MDDRGFKRRSYAESDPTEYGEPKDPAALVSSLDLKASTIKDLGRHIDEDGDTQMMVIYDDQNNIVNPATLVRTSTGNELTSLSQNNSQSQNSQSQNSQNRSEDTSREVKPRENESGEIPSLYLQQHDPAEAFYDEWDHDWFLQSLKRVYCRTNKYPPRFEKKLKVQASYKDYMLQLLRGLICWSYEDKLLTRGMPFLTNLFRRKHILMRLSNGIVQVRRRSLPFSPTILFFFWVPEWSFVVLRNEHPNLLTVSCNFFFLSRRSTLRIIPKLCFPSVVAC